MVDEYVTNLSVCDSRRKDWDIVLPAPVVDTFLIVDLFSETIDKLAGGPDSSKLSLFFVQLLENGSQPVLKVLIVVRRHKHVSGTVYPLLAQFLP